MRGLFVYRLLSIVVNMFSAFFAFFLPLGLFALFMNPSMGITIFIMLCFVLYAWFANRFLRQVIINQETFTKRNKDWLQVNAIVAFLVSVFSICSSAYHITHPASLKDLTDMLTENNIQQSAQLIRNSLIISICISAVFVIHIVWTIVLVRSHKDHIID
ncbi:MAG: hypothetical protein J0I41_17510 [Filimonas sp.]|nr:hypothetical protein [Filimonas sp.]